MSREREGDLDRFDDEGQEEGLLAKAWRLKQRRIVLEVALKTLLKAHPDNPSEDQDVNWTAVVDDIKAELERIKNGEG